MQKALRPLLRPDGAGSHTKLGYLIEGAHSGPTLLVPLPRGQASKIADAFRHIPRLGNIRGRLVVVNIGAIGADAEQDGWLRNQIGQVDETLYLTPSEFDGVDPRSVQQAMTEILRKATDLGMISGRGVIPLRQNLQDSVSISAGRGVVRFGS